MTNGQQGRINICNYWSLGSVSILYIRLFGCLASKTCTIPIWPARAANDRAVRLSLYTQSTRRTSHSSRAITIPVFPLITANCKLPVVSAGSSGQGHWSSELIVHWSNTPLSSSSFTMSGWLFKIAFSRAFCRPRRGLKPSSSRALTSVVLPDRRLQSRQRPYSDCCKTWRSPLSTNSTEKLLQ